MTKRLSDVLQFLRPASAMHEVAKGFGPSTIGLTHDAEYGAPRLSSLCARHRLRTLELLTAIARLDRIIVFARPH